MNSLRPLDLLVIAIYFAAVAAMAAANSAPWKPTETYFVAERRAMGLSVFATISSITFIAYPGAAFKGDSKLRFSHGRGRAACRQHFDFFFATRSAVSTVF